MIKVIIFDLGNVIVDVDKTNQLKKFAKAINKTPSYAKSYFESSSWRKAFERGEINAEQFYEKAKEELNLKMSFDEFKKNWCDIFELNKDVANLIKKLKKRYKLVLLSNTDKLHFEYIKNKYRIVDIFDDYVLSYKEGCRKPNPLIFLKAIKKAKTLPFNCIYFDDILEFIVIARLLGVKAFQYKNFGKLMKDLTKVL